MRGMTRLSLGAAWFAMLATGSVTGASAQSAAPSQADENAEPGVGDIVVTAQKRQESVNQVGMSITALSGETLTNLGVVNAEDLVKVVPGFNYTKGAYGQPVFTVRGIGFNETSLAAAPTVTAYVDEIPLPYSLMTEAVGLDLERVEVLKGPQGTLFGQNSTGGAINFIAAKPTAVREGGFDLTVARLNAISATAFVSGPLSETLRARLVVRKDYGDAWQRSVSRPEDRMGKTDRRQARFLLDWTPTDRLSLLLNLNGWQNKSEPQAGQRSGIWNGALRVAGSTPSSTGRRTCGMTSPARITSTRSPARMSFCAIRSSLWRHLAALAGVALATCGRSASPTSGSASICAASAAAASTSRGRATSSS